MVKAVSIKKIGNRTYVKVVALGKPHLFTLAEAKNANMRYRKVIR